MAKLLIFNPEHDYALANPSPYYTAPDSVKRIAKSLEKLPLVWAATEDCILLADNTIVRADGSGTISLDYALKIVSEIIPWGWDTQVRHRLRDMGFSPTLLPTDETLDTVRRLSHRRISIPFNLHLHSPSIPCEFFSVEEAMEYRAANPNAYFKLPWSSGGRGVVATEELSEHQTRQWLTGALRRQKSVLGEKGIDRTLDFASLWTVGKEVEFDGFSVSLSDGRGKYGGNMTGSQRQLIALIKKAAPDFDYEIIDRQKEFIQTHISEGYRGKMGIDMMVDRTGTVYPCVEINLRRTMGHVAMDYHLAQPEIKRRISVMKLPLQTI